MLGVHLTTSVENVVEQMMFSWFVFCNEERRSFLILKGWVRKKKYKQFLLLTEIDQKHAHDTFMVWRILNHV